MPDIDRDEVSALLPWLAAGSLPAVEAHRIEKWLAEQGDGAADLRAELAWLRVTAGHVKADVFLPSADLGLDKLMQRIHAKSPVKAAQPTAMLAGATSAPWAHAMNALRRWWGTPSGALALGGLAFAQAAVIAVLLWQPTFSEQEPLSDPRLPALGNAVLLQVIFAPSATEMQIRTALQRAQATLVGGPGALGLYTVAVPHSGAEAAAEALRQQTGTVESVSALTKP